MAIDKIQLLYNLRQNNNEDSSAYGKWYPRVVRRSTLSLRGLSDHIAGHGSIYTRDVVIGVLTKFRDCLVELVSEGVAVKMDGLGTFYPTIEATGAESAVGYDPSSHIQGVHVRYLPEDSANDQITSRAMMKKVSLKQNMIFDKTGKPKKVVDGQLVDYGTDDDEQNP